MSTPVSHEIADGIAVVTIDSPPVNAINQAVRQALLDTFTALKNQDGLKGVLLICAGRTFVAGADISEFDEPIAPPGYHTAFEAIESLDVPVAAAIHGTALGGGLELALSCHYRCALDTARVGLPELSLGIIPAAGGTQKLPRLIGAKKAVEFIIGVAPSPAAKARELGIVDHVVEGDLKEGALAYLGQLIADGAKPRRITEMDVDTAGYDEEFLATVRATAAKTMRGQNAPERLFEAIDFAIKLPIGQGFKEEIRIGDECMASDESKALRHMFFAEREINKIPGLAKDIGKKPVESLAILGAGTMGGGIAMVFANAGIPVTLIDLNQDAIDRGLATVKKNYETTVKRGRLSESAMNERMGLIQGATDYGPMKDADLIIEAVFEDIDLKKKVFADIDAAAGPDAILATNTSTLDIDAIAAATKRPESVIGLHFFSPANVMRLLEIVRAEKTDPAILATAVDLSKRIRKTGVVSGVCFGFIGNRMMIHGYVREADQMLLEGASPEQIDKAIYDFGFPMGPFAMNDMAGVDIMYSVLKTMGLKDANPAPYYDILWRIAEMGRHGQKTGAGFYKYQEGDRTPQHDGVTDEVIAKTARELGIAQGSIADEEIVERCVLGLVNEGARILAEGIAYRAGDIDVIWNAGYGFPRVTGGPMFYADLMGLNKVHDRVKAYHDRFGRYWEPAPLLAELARSGGTFTDWRP